MQRLQLSIMLTAIIVAARHAPADEIDPRVYLRPMQEDATLRAAHFVDLERGWAAGDRGAIWATVDGGHTWQLQDTGIAAPLASINFLTPDDGWAAGGEHQPYTHTSGGVLLRTRDGGRTWQQDRAALLPALIQTRFFGAAGIAVGGSSSIFPSGAFATDDGGRSWTPVQGTAVHGWTSGDFLDPFTGALAAPHGRLATVRRRAIEPSRTPSLGLRDIQALQLTPPTHGWLVGDGGLILWTADLGSSWQLPVGDVSAVAGEDFDWQALEVRGPRVWIAGSPGTRVLHSADAGRTWESFSTGQALPIHDLTFVDDEHGWAVGAMGTILKTSDGGRTWTRQRGGGARVAVLGLFAQPEAIPFELLAQLSGNEGYLAHVALLTRSDVDGASSDAATLAARTSEGLNGLGVGGMSSGWRFPLPAGGASLSSEQIVAEWNRVNDGRALERLEEQLVRTIRTWRPDIVVTHAAMPNGSDPLGHLVNQIVLRAVEQAGDPTRLPEHAARLGLEAWSVKKVFGRLPDGQQGAVQLATTQLAPRLGLALCDAGDAARGMVCDDYQPAPSSVGFQRLVDTLPQRAGQDDFMTGITLYPGGEARRLLAEPPQLAIEQMQRAAQKHRNLNAILERVDRSSTEPLKLAAQLGDMTSGLGRRAAGDVLFQLADHYRRAGQWDLAVECFERLIDEHPDHPLAPRACVWLIQYWSSVEVGYIRSRPATTDEPPAEKPEQVVERGQIVGQVLPPTVLGARELPIQAQGSNPKPDFGLRWQRAVELGKFIEQRYPALFAEPRVQFPLAAAQRGRGYPRAAEQMYLLTSRTRPQDAWWSCAAGEQWLARPDGEPPKPLWQVSAAARPPRLDGQLDDPVWQGARPAILRGTSSLDRTAPAVVWAAYDLECLYLAGRCGKAPDTKYSPSDQRRPRDPDLSHRDRIEITLDLDRDWSTSYRLTIDYRGWVAEDCWGVRGWNPRWYVASALDDESWTFEAAIPLGELAPDVPMRDHVWAAAAERIAPGVGVQSSVAGENSPQAAGLLLFK